ncbi:Arc family DNA-binding protein [Aeromonas hydrophila]
MSQAKPYPLRMSDEMRSFLQERADRAGRSLNAEILKRLQFTIDEEINSDNDKNLTVVDGFVTDGISRNLPSGVELIPRKVNESRYSPIYMQLDEIKEMLNSIRNDVKK